ncbi:MAG: flagellar motor switch protein FliM [Oscillospiraceae bacterium]
MAEVLSQSQIDALLSDISSGTIDVDVDEKKKAKKVKEYDFKSPKKFTKENLKTISSLHESFARLTSSYISGLLRYYSEVTVLSIEEQRYYEYNNALADNVLIGVVDIIPEKENLDSATVLIDITSSMGFLFIERLLGGAGVNFELDRDFTEIEIAILKNIFGRITTFLKDAWCTYLDVDASLRSLETNSRLMQVLMPDDTVLIIVMELKINGLKGNITVCIPAISLEDFITKFNDNQQLFGKKRSSTDNEYIKKGILSGLNKTELTISAVIDSVEIGLNDILGLKVNDVIPLTKNVNDNIEIMIDDKCWFEGKVGYKKNKKAVRIEKTVK